MIKEFKYVVTVKEFKEIVKDWPEVDYMGEPSEVWLSTVPGLSSECHRIATLNGGDLLLEI